MRNENSVNGISIFWFSADRKSLFSFKNTETDVQQSSCSLLQQFDSVLHLRISQLCDVMMTPVVATLKINRKKTVKILFITHQI